MDIAAMRWCDRRWVFQRALSHGGAWATYGLLLGYQEGGLASSNEEVGERRGRCGGRLTRSPLPDRVTDRANSCSCTSPWFRVHYQESLTIDARTLMPPRRKPPEMTMGQAPDEQSASAPAPEGATHGGATGRAEVPIPWEFRIKRFEKPITVPTQTMTERFNYWYLEGNRVQVGYHTPRETSQVDLGELIEAQHGQFLLIIDANVNDRVLEKIIPVLIDEAKRAGYPIIDVTRMHGRRGTPRATA